MVIHLFQHCHPPFQVCSPTFPRRVTHLFQDGHPPFPVCSPTFPRIVTHLWKDSSPSYQGRSHNFSFYWDGHPLFPAWSLGDVNFVWYHVLSILRISKFEIYGLKCHPLSKESHLLFQGLPPHFPMIMHFDCHPSSTEGSLISPSMITREACCPLWVLSGAFPRLQIHLHAYTNAC